MAKKHKAMVDEIIANEKLLISNHRALDKVQFTSQCTCCHRDANGSFALIVPGPNGKKSSITGAPLYTCKICKKEIDISNITEAEFEKAYDVFDRVCDVSKLQLDVNTEKDEKLHKRLKKFQYMMPEIRDAYKGISKGRGKKKNKNKGNHGFVEVGRY